MTSLYALIRQRDYIVPHQLCIGVEARVQAVYKRIEIIKKMDFKTLYLAKSLRWDTRGIPVVIETFDKEHFHCHRLNHICYANVDNDVLASSYKLAVTVSKLKHKNLRRCVLDVDSLLNCMLIINA